MNLIMLGAPGAGKGTVSKMFVEKDGLVQISTGDILRKNVTDKTPLGIKADEFMKKGALVPDDLILDLVASRLKEPDCQKGFILDGFPRTIPQAVGLNDLMKKSGIKIDAVVNIIVEEKEILKRLTSRRTCTNPKCQAIYNIYSMPPKKEGVCDKCGNPVVQRSDETEEAITNRLNTYNEKTAPLIDFYKKEGLLVEVDGNRASETVYQDTKNKVKK